nr:hypothetical protein [Mesorhizobium soli]
MTRINACAEGGCLTSVHQNSNLLGGFLKGLANLQWSGLSVQESETGTTRPGLTETVWSRPMMQKEIAHLDDISDAKDTAVGKRHRNGKEQAAIHRNITSPRQR